MWTSTTCPWGFDLTYEPLFRIPDNGRGAFGRPLFFRYDPGYNTFFRTIRFRTFTFAKNGKN